MTGGYAGPDRRRHHEGAAPVILTEDQMQSIVDRAAERAADLAVQRVLDIGFKAVGRTVVEKVLWIIGLCAVGLYFYLQSKGLLK